MKRNSHRIFQHITPTWDHDVHIHTNWSQDNLNGPSMHHYAELAEKYKIHIGFADHFELLYEESQSMKHGKWKLCRDSLPQYLEEIDQLQSEGFHVSAGLEVDYYPQRIPQLQAFLDEFYDQFDLIIGSVHEIEDFRPVTVQEDLDWLMEKYHSFTSIVDEYFRLEMEMVEQQLFDVIAHPDVVYRFCTPEMLTQHPEYKADPRVLEIGRLCASTKTLLEVNLSGIYKPWNQSFPNEKYMFDLIAEGTEFTIGSDSHSIEHFEKSVLDIRKFNRINRSLDRSVSACFTDLSDV